jgi:hypothetical protein
MNTLALGYTLPAIGRVTDLHRLENVRVERAPKQRGTNNCLYPFVNYGSKKLFY